MKSEKPLDSTFLLFVTKPIENLTKAYIILTWSESSL